MESFTCSNHLSSCCSTLCLAIIIIMFYLSTAATCLPAMKSSPNSTGFIKTSCGVTLYPDLCYKTLSLYGSRIHGSPRELANAALSVSLNEAKSASALVVKLSKTLGLQPREAGAAKDCVENTGDSVDELEQSLRAMKDLMDQGPEFEFQMSNIQTWVSAALTNEDTCIDNFEEMNGIATGKVKDSVRECLVRVSHLTSNALALINQLKNSNN